MYTHEYLQHICHAPCNSKDHPHRHQTPHNLPSHKVLLPTMLPVLFLPPDRRERNGRETLYVNIIASYPYSNIKRFFRFTTFRLGEGKRHHLTPFSQTCSFPPACAGSFTAANTGDYYDLQAIIKNILDLFFIFSLSIIVPKPWVPHTLSRDGVMVARGLVAFSSLSPSFLPRSVGKESPCDPPSIWVRFPVPAGMIQASKLDSSAPVEYFTFWRWCSWRPCGTECGRRSWHVPSRGVIMLGVLTERCQEG